MTIDESFLDPPDIIYSKINEQIWTILEDVGVDLKTIEQVCKLVAEAEQCASCIAKEESELAKELEQEKEYEYWKWNYDNF